MAIRAPDGANKYCPSGNSSTSNVFYESFRLMAINQDLNKNTIDNIAILNGILIQSIANGMGSLVTKLSAWT